MFSRLFRRKPTTIVIAPGQVLIRVTEEFLAQLMTRTHDGKKMTVEVGEPLPDGTYEPQITVEDDGMEVVARNRPKLSRVEGGRVIQ